jgi:protein-S-isoprenylcysteine O-methyltransferase Ste14
MNLRLRIPPLAVTVLAGALGWAVARLFPTLGLEHALRTWLAFGFVLAGVACSVLGVASFRRARTTVNPLQPEAASALVVSGIYRVTRNPMYLGFLALLLGELAWLAHPVALLAAPAFVCYLNRFQILPEEQALRHRFGPEYSLYAARVRRWL